MRKIATVSMIAAAAFAVAACSKTESTNTTTEINATDMNAMVATEGTMNDTMTNTDGAMAGNMMDNSAMAIDNASNSMENAANKM